MGVIGLPFNDVLVFLATAALLVPAFSRTGLGAGPAFLLAGIVLGPQGFGRFAVDHPWVADFTLENPQSVMGLAEFGVAFLFFAIGLELSFERLRDLKRLVFGLGIAQVLVTGIAIGGLALAFGNAPSVALILAGAFSFASTALIVQLLKEQGRLGSGTGKAAFAVLLLQDVAVVPLLLMVDLLGPDNPANPLVAVGLSLGKTFVAVAVIVAAGRYLIRPLFRAITRSPVPDLSVAATLLLVVSTTGLAHTLGLSVALGTFLAGLLCAETEFRPMIEVDTAPFRGLLVGLFFMATGASISFEGLTIAPLWLAASVFGLIVLKIACLTPLARLFDLSWGSSLELGFLLATPGEFAFVVIEHASDLGLMPQDLASFMLLVAGLSFLGTPLVARLGHRLRHALARPAPQPDLPAPPRAGHVIVVGYGRVGRQVVEMLQESGIPWVAIDADPAIVADARAHGRPVIQGSITQTALLEELGLARARLLAIAVDEPVATAQALRLIRRLPVRVPVVTRARNAQTARRLRRFGAEMAVPDMFESGMTLGHAVLVVLNIPRLQAQPPAVERRAVRAEPLG